jgi:hypothetical protein
MRLDIRMRRQLVGSAMLLAWSAVAAAQPEPPSGPALELVPAGAQVLHCGVSKGVLYVTYEREGRAAIAPAFHTPAIGSACAAAGHPLAGGPRARLAAPIVAPRIGVVPAPAPPGTARATVEPSFTVRADGGSIRIDGRNDGDVALHCVINFSWTSDNEPGGSRAVITQATLPARQSNQVLVITGAQPNLRVIGLPRWNCRPNN